MLSGSGDELVDVLVVLALDYDFGLAGILPNLLYRRLVVEFLFSSCSRVRKHAEAEKKRVP